MLGDQIIEEYSHLQEIPDYINKFQKTGSSKRKLSNGAVYDAYQEDIALVHIYWDSPSALQFERSLRLTWIDYMSQVMKKKEEF